MRTFVSLAALAPVFITAAVGCSKGGAAGPGSADGSVDGSAERTAVLCSTIDASAQGEDGAPGVGTDEFGPNAPAAKTASSIGRVNVYEAASASLLERVDVYLRADLAHTRVTIAVQEAASRTVPFRKVADVQLAVDSCEGWASSGPLAIPMEAGRFYAIGLDPNQAVTGFISADMETLPIDGVFGRLIGSKAATSVSVPTITWEKFTDKEYNRQRLQTSPRVGSAGDAGTAADATDGAADADGGRDAGGGPG